MEKRYTATVYVAAPGTPLTVPAGGTSAAGHVYYSISDGGEEKSYGFAPAAHGQSSGSGKVYRTDVKDYKDPHYSRTMEISKEQYDKLQEFGKAPAKQGFDMEYSGAANSCVDFTWGALNHAGLHRDTVLGKDRNFEGALKPLDNIRYIKSIEAPFPKSELNTEQNNKMPDRTPLQWFLSDQQQLSEPVDLARRDAGIGQQEPLVSQAEAAVRRLDGTLGREYDSHSACMAASAACLAKSNGFSRIDHIVLNEGGGTLGKGESLFVVQGALDDPANRWASMRTQEAVTAPVERSVAQMQALGDAQRFQPSISMDKAETQVAQQPRMV